MPRLALLVALLWSWPLAARASCAISGFDMLWSYPAEGQRDVPTNATFWVLTTLPMLSHATAWLNDVPIALTQSQREGLEPDNFRIQAGELRANTAYTLRVRYAWPSEAEAKTFVIHFRTGSKPARRAARARVVGRSVIVDTRGLPCPELSITQGCFDTIGARPTRTQSFELAGGAAVAWLVNTIGAAGEGGLLWPAQCGDPNVIVRESRGDECFTLQAIGQGGSLSPPIRHCASPTDRPTSASRRGFEDVGHALDKRGPIHEAPPATGVAEEPIAEPPALEPPALEPPAPRPAAPAVASKRGCTLASEHAGGWAWLLLALALARAAATRGRATP